MLVLTFARMTMGVQFQMIPALAPVLTANGGMSYAGVGTLTGAYLVPGVLVALAGGWLSQRMGDARCVMLGLMLMALGGCGALWAEAFNAQLFWRLVAGSGAVCLNVLVTKMVADWFDGRGDLPTAMGLLVSSWPAGIAIAALALPFVEAVAGFSAALLLPVLLCVAAFICTFLVWQEPPEKPDATASNKKEKMHQREFVMVVMAGLIWGLYNTVFVGVIAWMPALFAETGVAATAAAAYASLISWVGIASVVAGGWLAGRLKRPDVLAVACLLGSAGLICGLAAFPPVQVGALSMLVLGAVIGPIAAIVMTLPVKAARAQTRGAAMGLYFALYYAAMGFAPPLYGVVGDATQTASAPLYMMAGVLVLCTVIWGGFRRFYRDAA